MMDGTVKPAEEGISSTENPSKSPEVQATAPAANVSASQLEARIVGVLRTIYDPEIPVNIYEIGLIYGVDIDAANAVTVRMTLTSPACPAAGTLPGEVEDKVRGVPGVSDVKVHVVWDPAWSPALMSESAKLQLGML
jgi:FeS assembly SUF system protein